MERWFFIPRKLQRNKDIMMGPLKTCLRKNPEVQGYWAPKPNPQVTPPTPNPIWPLGSRSWLPDPGRRLVARYSGFPFLLPSALRNLLHDYVGRLCHKGLQSRELAMQKDVPKRMLVEPETRNIPTKEDTKKGFLFLEQSLEFRHFL